MLQKNRNKRVGLCVMVVSSCLVLAVVWAFLARPETALAKKPVKPDESTHYDVTMTGDLTLVGSFNVDPPDGWAISFDTGIRVTGPRPKICVTTDFLDTGGVALDGDACPDCDGVIPDGDGAPNWGVLNVEGDSAGVIVTWYIGETDAVTGKIKRYTLSSVDPFPVNTMGSGTWPNGEGDDVTVHEVIIPIGTQWNLVQAKPGNLDTILISTQPTVITFTEYTGS
jgi:hypothetical protein